ncbi:MAG: hypothetical protein Q8L44_15660 [Sulfuritalea sp.]|nr:hypothetical protein [Sulfuritalea sp.]
MIRRAAIPLLGAAAFALIGTRVANAQPVTPGSTAFCLYEIPVDEAGKRRWINLGIVQYVEATRTELKISYGGGGFGSGHDVKIAVASMDEASAVLEKIRRVAAACR